MNETMISIRPFCEEDLGEWFRLRQLLWDETDQEDVPEAGILQRGESAGDRLVAHGRWQVARDLQPATCNLPAERFAGPFILSLSDSRERCTIGQLAGHPLPI